MKIQVFEIGNEKNKILMIDDFHPNPDEIIEFANSLAPFPIEDETNYPGIRVKFKEYNTYLEYIDKIISPLALDLFDVNLVIEMGCFSMVTKESDDLNVFQRVPHYDHLSPNYFAFLHYLFKPNFGGTSFYRHKETGIELVSVNNKDQYRAIMKAQMLRNGVPKSNYINDSNEMYERIFNIEAKFNRIAFYCGAILHSGDVTPQFNFSTNPYEGRLTGNVFYNGI